VGRFDVVEGEKVADESQGGGGKDCLVVRVGLGTRPRGGDGGEAGDGDLIPRVNAQVLGVSILKDLVGLGRGQGGELLLNLEGDERSNPGGESRMGAVTSFGLSTLLGPVDQVDDEVGVLELLLLALRGELDGNLLVD
jgi:hypothetical protein